MSRALAAALIVGAGLLLWPWGGTGQDSVPEWAQRRSKMVREQVKARGVRSPRVVDATRQVPRERFVPENVPRHSTSDSPLPIGFGQTISQPYIVAHMTEILDVRQNHRVLEIDTGSGYQTAVLATLSDSVHSVEIVPQLADRARKILAELGFGEVKMRTGDGDQGWAEHAPYDRILVTAAPPEMPEALLEQLSAGGRLVAPVGSGPSNQRPVVVTKNASGRIRRRPQLPVRFVPMVRGESTIQ